MESHSAAEKSLKIRAGSMQPRRHVKSILQSEMYPGLSVQVSQNDLIIFFAIQLIWVYSIRLKEPLSLTWRWRWTNILQESFWPKISFWDLWRYYNILKENISLFKVAVALLNCSQIVATSLHWTYSWTGKDIQNYISLEIKREIGGTISQQRLSLITCRRLKYLSWFWMA